MRDVLLDYLRCPVNRTRFNIQIINKSQKLYDGELVEIIKDGILFTDQEWFYPVINGIPRLTVEAFLDYEPFLRHHLPDFEERKKNILSKYGSMISLTTKKNSHTKKSFGQEWSIFNYEEDKTWNADADKMVQTFLDETDETKTSLKDKLIFDAGCGNGLLNQFIAQLGARIIGMDLSQSVERAFEKNSYRDAFFIQGDVQFPPIAFAQFDIVHSSGVLICTNNSELTFSCLEPCVKPGGKLSVWLYHPRKDFIHNLFNFIRNYTSKLPIKVQYYLYLFTLFPISYVIKRLKGNKQNKRELMIDLLDWFSPKYRWEHYHDEATAWFLKRNFSKIKVTTDILFGFNITGHKKSDRL